MNKWRQKFHLEAPIGFLNDPNGLCHFKGIYHIFFQYCPSDAEGNGSKSWGHYTTTDFVSYTFLGEAISPTIPEDSDGVYSGSALIHNDTMYLYYTGNTKEVGDFDYVYKGRGANEILVTSENGIDMSEKKVLLRNIDYPDYCSCHVRDPKIWKEGDIFYMILGARSMDDEGLVLFYQSEDLENWTYLSDFKVNDMGFMWECPDYFTMGDSAYLSISPQGLEANEFKNQNIYQAGYAKVEGDIENLSMGEFQEWDMGFDFYAPQTFDDELGRKILIGWMGMPDADYGSPTVDLGFQHCLTIPRQLCLHVEGKILQQPIQELLELRDISKPIVNGKYTLPFEMEAMIQENEFEIIFDDKLEFKYKDGIVEMTFTQGAYGSDRGTRKAKIESVRNIRVFADTSSVEIFLNDGEMVFTTKFFPDSDVEIRSSNLVGEIYQLKSFIIN